jgi:S-formylglutathione hydrolase FrmB
MQKKLSLRKYSFIGISIIIYLLLLNLLFGFSKNKSSSNIRFEVSFPQSVHKQAITGRVYVILTRDNRREPRLQMYTHGAPFFGSDVEGLKPGEAAVIDEKVLGYPMDSLNQIPAGDYYVQGFINIYTQFHRVDGHTVWLHMDQWEGQHFNISPGNLYSEVQQIHFDPKQGGTIKLIANKIIPPIKISPDTEWVKRIKIKSKLISEFWGRPMYLGATILLPKGYHKNPDKYYPTIYLQGHFSLWAPMGFTTEEPKMNNRWARLGYEFYKEWVSSTIPPMLIITFQHPTPYYDDSYAVNSENNGPYGDAIIKELIPYIEKNFRAIPKPYARLLTGGSTGGWEALALQIFHPDFFGGCWSLCPDPVDFRYFQMIDIYKDKNAFYKELGWLKIPTASDRDIYGMVTLTSAQRNRYELVRGTKSRSGEQIDIFEATYGLVGEDGYPQPLFNPLTGEIDPEVANYWKEHYDLSYYLEKNWPTIGPQLVGKLHIYTGDMDTFYLNNAVYLLEDFLENRTNPYYAGTVEYGDRKPHCWGPYGAELIKLMAVHLKKYAAKERGFE